MRTLIIGDLHLDNKHKGLLKAQINCICNIVSSEKLNDIIFLGDIFMHRKPSPSVLLAFQRILEACSSCEVTVLRGNHDSETKADNGVTALSIFENYEYTRESVRVVTQTWKDVKNKRVFIPHYEDEDTTIKALEDTPEGYTVFGHFGYAGSINSSGDRDSTIPLDKFSNQTYLGHVHQYTSRKTLDGISDLVILGTPYTTNFGEAGKESYYGILEDSKFYLVPVESGPRHVVINVKDINNNLEYINNDLDWTTFLRVKIDSDHYPIPYDKLTVNSIDVTYNPLFNEEDLSTFSPERDLFSINEVIIEDYVDGANSIIPKDTLMDGYRQLRNEN